MTTPQRTCLACRARADKPILLRLVWDGSGGVLVDESQRLPGRGAYLHLECVERAIKTGAVGRALRRSVDRTAVREQLRGRSVG